MARELVRLRAMTPEQFLNAKASGQYDAGLIAQAEQERGSPSPLAKILGSLGRANAAGWQGSYGDGTPPRESPIRLGAQPQEPDPDFETQSFDVPPRADLLQAAPRGSGSIVPHFAVDAQSILKNAGSVEPSPELPEVSKPNIIEAEEPQFDENYGKVDPNMSLLRAGLGILSMPGGLSALQAIGQGGIQGVDDFQKQKVLAAQQNKEMREARGQYRQELRGNEALNRQYDQDVVARAKVVHDMKVGDARIDEEKKKTALQAAQLAQDGQYKEAYLKLNEAEMLVKYPEIIRDPMKGLQRAQALMDSDDPKERELGYDMRQLIMGRVSAGQQNADTRRDAAQLTAAQKILADPMASPEDKIRARTVIKQIQMRSMGVDSVGPTALPPPP
jgi:hypothetical protein